LDLEVDIDGVSPRGSQKKGNHRMAIFEHGAEYADEKKSQEKEKEEEKPKD